MRKRMLAVLLSVVMVLGILPVTASAGEGENPVYLALGDSITTGYAPPLENGTPQEVERPFADQVAAAQGYELTNMAEDGETSASLLTKLQETNSDELAAVTSADLITITVGGNDLMGALYAYLAEEYVKENPDVQGFDADDAKALLMSGNPAFLAFAVGKISGGDFTMKILATLETFTTNLTAIVEEIKQANPQASILVATQYNPYYYLAKSTEGTPFADTASKISSAFETGVKALNQVISTGAASADYQVVDVYTAFETAADSGINPCNPSYTPPMTISLDFHPNQTGHDLIAKVVNGELAEKWLFVYVNNKAITSHNYMDVFDDGTVSYDAVTNTLTLDGAHIESYYSAGIYAPQDSLIINLKGENIINQSGGLKAAQGINVNGDLTIRGDGSLLAPEIEDTQTAGKLGKGILVKNDLVIEGNATVTMHTLTGIEAMGEISICGNAKVNCTASGFISIYGRGNSIEISEDAQINVTGIGGIQAEKGDICISGNAVVDSTGAEQNVNGSVYKFNAIWAPAGKIKISENAQVFGNSGYAAICAYNGVNITGGTVSAAASDDAAIWSNRDVEISGSGIIVNTFIKDENEEIVYSFHGIGAANSVIIDGSTINAGTIDGLSIWSNSKEGKTVISNSVVNAYAGESKIYSAINCVGNLEVKNSWVRADGVSATAPSITDSVFIDENTGSVSGNYALTTDQEICQSEILTIPEDAVLTIPDGVTLTNNGTLTVEGIMEVCSAGQFTGAADISGKVYVLETESGANPADGATLTLKSGGEVYAQLTELEGTTITPASRTSGSYLYTPVNGSEENFVNRWSYYRGSSSSGTTTYTSTAETTENGTVAISPKNASKGTEVTVTVTPDEGYVLESLTVTDKNGTEIELTDQGDGKYSFTMPASNVKVDAVFAEEEPASTLPFSDVASDDWFCEAVQYVFDNGMMNGVGNDLFAPDSNLTRGMIAQVLYNLEGTPEAGSDAFTDVEAGQWYADAVNWAAANDVVSGYGDSTFGPQKDITREQMAQILYNYAVFKGYDVSVQGDLSVFSDGTATSDWALPAVKWAVGSGLLQGYAGRLNPAGTATRAEVAQILMNFCENIVK